MKRIILKLWKIFTDSDRSGEIAPDEVLLDANNLPKFDDNQFEGRLEKPISKMIIAFVGLFFALLIIVYSIKIWNLQIRDGDKFLEKSEKNTLRHYPVFAARGIIYDKNGQELAWNVPSDDSDFMNRKYIEAPGLAHLLGYVQYPSKDKFGIYYRQDFIGIDGVEKIFNKKMQGENGLKIIEVDALGKIQSQNIIEPPKAGENVNLSIDYKVQSALHGVLKDISNRVGFAGGAGIIMDVNTGEVLAITSYPEFSPEVMSEGKDKDLIKKYNTDKNKPFLDRAIDGVYAPGSTVKTYVAIGALNEGIIDPLKTIVSTGQISIPNENDPKKFTIFKDWKAHGAVDMRKALAVSSDVYFYALGGGYKDQKGLGIDLLDKYFSMFGFGQKIDSIFFNEGNIGTVPNPEWKKRLFNGETWRLGNSYHTAIGQFGFQVTPAQAVRAVSAIANSGKLIDPTVIKGEQGKVERIIDIPEADFKVIREGMRLAVKEGTARALDVSYVDMAAKSGTAELGVSKDTVNSWIIGFWPYEKPKYAFALVLEKGSAHNVVGTGVAMREFIDIINRSSPEYFK